MGESRDLGLFTINGSDTMTTTEKNAAIARFLGSDYINKPWKDRNGILHDYWHWSKPDCGYPSSIGIGELSTAWGIGNFHFHSDWNWLCLVVEKIESLKNKYGFGFSVRICRKHCSVESHNYSEVDYIVKADSETKIGAVYTAVYQFVVWHNQQQE